VSFERRQFTISRHHGKIFFDGTEAPRQIVENKSKEVRLIEIFDGLNFSSDKQFDQWARKLRGTRTYTFDEVTLVAANGSTVTQPLVFFDRDQRADLDTKWHAWLTKRQAEMEEANRVKRAQEQETKQYEELGRLRELQTRTLQAQTDAAEKSARSLAVISGETSLWEVELVPVGSFGGCTSCSDNLGVFLQGTSSAGVSLFANGGNLASSFGTSFNIRSHTNSIYVKAYGRTSQVASDEAVHSNPGYRAASIRKLAG
jgi:hypothetical protein